MKIGIIGAGLIGEKRAAHSEGAQLIAVCDPVKERAEKLARNHNASVEKTWQSLIRRKDLDAVCVCTTHDHLSSIELPL